VVFRLTRLHCKITNGGPGRNNPAILCHIGEESLRLDINRRVLKPLFQGRKREGGSREVGGISGGGRFLFKRRALGCKIVQAKIGKPK